MIILYDMIQYYTTNLTQLDTKHLKLAPRLQI